VYFRSSALGVPVAGNQNGGFPVDVNGWFIGFASFDAPVRFCGGSLRAVPRIAR
jgi:hypothetical protein